MRRFVVLLAAFVAIQPAHAQPETPRQLFTQVSPILDGLSDITGWKIRRKVPADFISKEKLNQYIQQRIRDVVKPEEIRVESLALKMFGFLPEDYDLKQAVVDLMTEQAAAFYDYDRKRLFVTESDSSFLEKRAALVHELAHALADQSFPLGKFLRKGAKNDDAATAREAVIEGQAMWLMWAYVAKLGGGEAKVSETILDSMKGSASSLGSQYPVFQKAPLYLRESLMFPYTGGLQFQNAVFEKIGTASFDLVFRRPPVSTQQVLHPEKFLANTQPSDPPLPSLDGAKRYRTLAEGTVGELDFHVLLEQYAGKEAADRIAPHWRGGRFRLYESKQDRRPVLVYAAEWDSAEAAQEFFEAYHTVLESKWRKMERRKRTDSHYAGVGDRGAFVVTLNGAVVSSVEGTPVVR
jgi:hypothetical protein